MFLVWLYRMTQLFYVLIRKSKMITATGHNLQRTILENVKILTNYISGVKTIRYGGFFFFFFIIVQYWKTISMFYKLGQQIKFR